jgi:uncharacterized small protein (DUF1192 family)
LVVDGNPVIPVANVENEASKVLSALVPAPKRGSWLNMAETELNVLSGQCLERRIPDKAMLTEETAAWEAQRNKKHAKTDWQFTTADARVKLKRLYPSF